jgi:hypothetical protein
MVTPCFIKLNRKLLGPNKFHAEIESLEPQKTLGASSCLTTLMQRKTMQALIARLGRPDEFALVQFSDSAHTNLAQICNAPPEIAFSSGAIDCDIDSPTKTVSRALPLSVAHF